MNLTTPNKVKNGSRPISGNFDDDRLQRFIIEAEQIHVKPRIGDELYIDLLKYVNSDAIQQTSFPVEYKTLLEGGIYYANSCCNVGTFQFMGLIEALNYYVYAGLIKSNDYNVTRFGGSMVKRDDYSQRPELREKLAAEKDTLIIADTYMNECIGYLEANKENIPLFKSAGIKENMLQIQIIGE